LDGYQALSLKTAEAIAAQLRKKPDSCLGLPTGRTPLGCYELLSQWSRDGKLDWSQARCFALDDYLDVQEVDSFAHYLQENLYQHTNLPLEQRFNPRFSDNYDQLIADCGGLDLTVIGIGSNGHIAFNEPGTPRHSWTNCIWLTESTRQANAAFFSYPYNIPNRAVTMGIATILASRQLILIANGERKQEILSQALNGPRTSEVPASYLQEHHNLQIFTDFDYQHAGS
jgi:glucosamine-6-phosphate deaminase